MSSSQLRKKGKHRKRSSPWPKVLLAGGGLLILLGVFFAFSQPAKPKAKIEVSGKPSLKVDEDKVDLGNVKLGQTVNVSFQLSNVGDQPLRFSEAPTVEVKEGC